MPKGPGSSDKIDSWAWRHYGCTTKRQITNMKKDIGEDASELDGYEDLREEDQDKIKAAWEAGEVDEADSEPGPLAPFLSSMPGPSPRERQEGRRRRRGRQRRPQEEGAFPSLCHSRAETVLQKAAPKRKKAESDDEDVKPKKKAAPRKKTKKAETDDDEGMVWADLQLGT
jgi:hypothetical protein